MADWKSQRGAYGRLRTLFAHSLVGAPLPPEGCICALPIPGSEANRLGRDRSGFACLVIPTPVSPAASRPDVRLENLRVQRRVMCEVTRPTGERESLSGVVVTCCAESEDLRGFFLDLFDQALDALGPIPNEREIDSWIDHAARLFAELEEPAVREVRGLWGELFVISEARNPETMIRRWHEDPDDRYDFMAGSFALEVKTCRDLERVHEFSLLQIRPRTDMDVMVASVPTHADPQGLSVADLLAEIEKRVMNNGVRVKLRETVFRTAGVSLAEVNPRRFDRRAAKDGLRFMTAAAVPALEECPPAEVLEVRLRIRCRDVPGHSVMELIEARLGAT